MRECRAMDDCRLARRVTESVCVRPPPRHVQRRAGRRPGRPIDAQLESLAVLLAPHLKVVRVRLDEADRQSRDHHACEQVPRAVDHVVQSPRLDALLCRKAVALGALLEVAPCPARVCASSS